jgi:uncharacterized iron-regulated protein
MTSTYNWHKLYTDDYIKIAQHVVSNASKVMAAITVNLSRYDIQYLE